MKKKEVYDHITNVNTNLAAIAEELHRVSTTQSVNLEAHFGRFGYDAHVRTYDDEQQPSSSSYAEADGKSVGERYVFSLL
jgi:hypothetical protein